MTRTALLLAAASILASAAHSQTADAPTGTSKPQPTAIPDTIPPPQDRPYPGTLRLAVDATDTTHGIFRVKETVPVQAGPVTLLYPKWLPGNHSPTGQISRFAGLVVSANGQTIPWTRDPVDVFAFHVDVPQGVSALDLSFQFLSPTDERQGRIQATPVMMSLQWDALALYPAGYFTRQIPIQASVTYPAGWTSYTALRPSGAATAAGGTVTYETVAFDTLVDSPTIAGAHARTIPLSPDVNLDVLADRPDQLEAAPEQIDAHKALVTQAVRLFGAQHYNHYDFLFTLSDRLGGEGLEHHRSSEDGTNGSYFTDWKTSVAMRDLLAHEFTHSWDGKFRRGADLWTPDYRTPMRDSLLWVYEGQTQFWGNVLAARSGLVPKEEAYDALAAVAASYQNQAGRSWRPLADTTNDPIIARRAPAPWGNWQRSEDYYSEGQLVWLDADSLIREKTGGRKSIDDFARAFFGMKDRDWGELTYTFDDVVATLNGIVPYDWATFLRTRVYQVAPQPPLDWLARDGYRLVYTDKPGAMWEAREKMRKVTDLSYSLGLVLTGKGDIGRVAWDSPAFKAGLTNGTAIVAVNGQAYDGDALKRAVTEAKNGQPISLLVKVDDQYRTVSLTYTGGLRYPHLERTGKGPGALDMLYAPRTHA
jgi:predicted metalloprotease with PDZ domain